MTRLNVREPDIITRVTEFVPEIVEFVEGIIKNGYAYESEGSVYFNTLAFDKAEGHAYAKLEPWSKGNRELLEDGEGLQKKINHLHQPDLDFRFFIKQGWSPLAVGLCLVESLKTR